MAKQRKRQILATSGGFIPGPNGQFHWSRGPLVNYALKLSGKARPRFCYLDTASGDSLNASRGLINAFGGCDDAIVSTLELFNRPNVSASPGSAIDGPMNSEKPDFSRGQESRVSALCACKSWRATRERVTAWRIRSCSEAWSQVPRE